MGPVAGGILNHYFGWQSIFIMTFIVSGTVFVTALLKLPKAESGQNELSFDVLGNILFISMITAIMFGFSEIAASRLAFAVIGLGIILAALFARHELKAENPIIPVRLFAG
jgi:hypothetical protein